MMQLVTPRAEDRKDFELSLDEIAREGARRLLIQALNLEVEDHINQHTEAVDESWHRLVVRNGAHRSRTVTMGSGSIEIKAPRVDDRREGAKFTSAILPPYLRKSPKVETALGPSAARRAGAICSTTLGESKCAQS
jgi:transposase-like protein